HRLCRNTARLPRQAMPHGPRRAGGLQAGRGGAGAGSFHGLTRGPAGDARGPCRADQAVTRSSRDHGGDPMPHRMSLSAIGLILLVSAPAGAAQFFDPAKYPDMAGRWGVSGVNQWARGEKAPLTAEYQAIFEANLKDVREGGQGTDPMYRCL